MSGFKFKNDIGVRLRFTLSVIIDSAKGFCCTSVKNRKLRKSLEFLDWLRRVARSKEESTVIRCSTRYSWCACGYNFGSGALAENRKDCVCVYKGDKTAQIEIHFTGASHTIRNYDTRRSGARRPGNRTTGFWKVRHKSVTLRHTAAPYPGRYKGKKSSDHGSEGFR